MHKCKCKTKDIILYINSLHTFFTFILKAKARDYGKGHYISVVVFGQSQCTVSAGQSEHTVLVGRRHRGPTIMYSIWKIMCFLNIKACQHQIHKIMILKKSDIQPSMVTRTQNLCSTFTHPSAHTQQWTHTRYSGQSFMLWRRGAVGGSVPCSRAPCRGIEGGRECCTFSPPTYNSYRPEIWTFFEI